MKDIRNLDLNLLKALDALLDHRNVTRAAARLGVTQPAMSGMLTRLRDAFDDPLFVRAQRGIEPTERAQSLAIPLKQVLGEVGALLQPPVFDPATANHHFTIASTDYALRAIALPFLATLKRLAPNIKVALVLVNDTQMLSQLERGVIDVALVSPEYACPDLHARKLFDEHYVCVVRQDHPVVKTQQDLTLERFCELDHALVSYTGAGFRGATDEALAKIGKTRRVTVSVKSFLIVPDLLRASDMVSILPSRLVTDLAGLAVFEPPIAIAGFTNMAAWHERTHRDPAQRWLRQLLFDICFDNHAQCEAGPVDKAGATQVMSGHQP